MTMSNPPTKPLSGNELMQRMPQLGIDAANAARARARETGTPIVIMRDGVLVHEYDPAPLSDDNGAEPGDRKRA